jgi:hypothetical protein
MRSITIDILNEKALQLLRDLEKLNLIKLRTEPVASTVDWLKYKGAMSKESIEVVDRQLDSLRGDWE